MLERLDAHKVAGQDGALRMSAGQAFYNTSEQLNDDNHPSALAHAGLKSRIPV